MYLAIVLWQNKAKSVHPLSNLVFMPRGLQKWFKLYFKKAILVFSIEFRANLSCPTQWDDRQMFVNESN